MGIASAKMNTMAMVSFVFVSTVKFFLLFSHLTLLKTRNKLASCCCLMNLANFFLGVNICFPVNQ